MVKKSSKKAWKNIDTTEIEEAVKEFEEKQRTKVDLTKKADDDLFVVDEIGHTQSRSKRKAQKKQEETLKRVDAAKEAEKKKRDEEKAKLAALYREKAEKERAAKQRIRNVRLLKGDKVRQAKKAYSGQERMYDLWGDSSSSNDELKKLPPPARAAAWHIEQFAKRRVTNTERTVEKLNKLREGTVKAPVVVPTALSINPPTKAYANTLEAIAKKIKKRDSGIEVVDKAKTVDAAKESEEFNRLRSADVEPEGEKFVPPPLSKFYKTATLNQRKKRRARIAYRKLQRLLKKRQKELNIENNVSANQLKEFIEQTIERLERRREARKQAKAKMLTHGRRTKAPKKLGERLPDILLPEEMPKSLMDVPALPLVAGAFFDKVRHGSIHIGTHTTQVKRASALRSTRDKDAMLTDEDFEESLKRKEAEASKNPRVFYVDEKQAARAHQLALHKARKRALRSEKKKELKIEEKVDKMLGRLGEKRARPTAVAAEDDEADFIPVSREESDLDDSDMELLLGYQDEDEDEDEDFDDFEEDGEEEYDEADDEVEEEIPAVLRKPVAVQPAKKKASNLW